jgi:hypothetical protein
MIGQACGQHRRPPSPAAVFVADAQCPYCPAEVIAVQCEIGHRVVNLSILTEAVRPPRLPRITTSDSRVLPCHGRRVHALTRLRFRHRRVQTALGPEDPASLDGDHLLAATLLVHRRVVQPLGQEPLGPDAGTAQTAGRRHYRFAERVLDSRNVRPGLVAGVQLRQLAPEPLLQLRHDGIGVVDRPRPRNHGQNQPVLGTGGDVVLVVALMGIGGKSHELVGGRCRVLSGPTSYPGESGAVDTDQAAGLPDAVALGGVIEHRARLVLRNTTAKGRI